MHEYSIVSALLGRVQQEAVAQGATSVARLEVTIGELAGVETALLQTAWEVFVDRGLCADAELVLTTVPARWVCRSCGADLPAGAPLHCLSCDAPARLASGDEILLNRIEMEVPHV